MNTERPQNNLGYLLHHMSSMLAKQSDQVLQERLGVGMSQFRILRVLQAKPHIKQRQIADHLGQTEASISRQVKLMVDEGLLRVTISPKSRREHVTLLTAKGERLTEAALDALAKYHEPTYHALSEKQREALFSGLETIHAVVCPGHETAKNA